MTKGEMRLNFFSLSRLDGLSNNEVTSFAKDGKGFVWIGTVNGLNRYNGYDFKTYRHATGEAASLPGNNIVDMLIDTEGEMWVGIFGGGVARYNAKSDNFKTYSLVTDIDKLAPDEVMDLCADSSNTIWALSSGGLFHYDRQSDSFSKIPVTQEYQFSDTSIVRLNGLTILSDTISAIAADDKGGMWIVYPDFQLSYLHPEKAISEFFQGFKTIFPSTENVFFYKATWHNGLLYLASLGMGVIVYDTELKQGSLLIDRAVLSTATDVILHDGQLWITSFNGVINYDLETGTYIHYLNKPGDPKSLRSASANRVFIDDYGILWIGLVNSGVNYANINIPFRQIYEDMAEPSMLSQPKVNTMLHDSRGNLWIGYQSGNIEYFPALGRNRVEVNVRPLGEDAGVGAIFRIFEDSRGDIYMGSWLGGLQKYSRETNSFISVGRNLNDYIDRFHGVDVRDIEEDGDGNLWLIVHGRGLVKYNKSSGMTHLIQGNPANLSMLSNAYLFDLCFDDNQGLWVSSAWGTNRIPPNDTIIKRYFASRVPGSIISDFIQVIHKDIEGRIWFGSNAGLSLYNPDDDTFFNIFFEDHNLPNILIKAIREDSLGNLWISTSSGILRLDLSFTSPNEPEVTDFFIYDVNHGILSEDFFTGSASKDRLGNIYFGGISGVDYFNPGDFTKAAISALVCIEEIRLFNKVIYPGTAGGPQFNDEGEILFSHKENMLGFKFVSLSYFEQHRNNYYYRLDPLDTEWQHAGNDRSVTFANLAPGQYVFRTKTCFSPGDCENEGESISFIVLPPFWQTTLFRVLVLLLVLAALTTIQILGTARMRKKKLDLERLVRLRTDELSQKNQELVMHRNALNKANVSLEDRQRRIEQQSEELMAQAESLLEKNNELNRTNSVKDKLFSIIAHDLRNPFGTTMGLADLLKSNYKHYDDATRLKFIENISASADKAFTLLDNLLQWSSAQAGRINAKCTDLVLYDQVQATFEIVHEGFERKRVQFINAVEPGLHVYADLELLQIVFRNLITNALKFTPGGGQVSVRAEKTGDGMVRVDVTDTGSGISSDVLNSLFASEEQTTKAGTGGETGSGLGLLLCHEFVGILGGRIWVEKTSPGGTTFSFTLWAEAR